MTNMGPIHLSMSSDNDDNADNQNEGEKLKSYDGDGLAPWMSRTQSSEWQN